MKFTFNDGGRKEAGFKGETGDCVTRAIAIATEKPYQEVYDNLFALARKLSKKGNSLIARQIQLRGASLAMVCSEKYTNNILRI